MAVAQEKAKRTTRGRAAKKSETTTTTRRRTTTRKRAGAEESTGAAAHRTATLPVPVVTPHVEVHKFRVPAPPGLPVSRHEVVEAGKGMTSFLPPPRRLAFYTGLGAMAVFGIVEWPVAAAIGVGVGIARGAGRSREQRPSDKQETGKQEEKEEPRTTRPRSRAGRK